MIPEWMKAVDVGPCACSPKPARRRNYVGKTLGGIFGFLEEALVSESYARRDGLLQSLDPRAKLVSIIAFIVAVTMVADWRLLAVAYALTIVFASASRIGIAFFVQRVWLFIPVFAGIIALPMVLNIVSPGESLLVLATFGPGARLGPFALPETLAVTVPGTLGAITFTLRVATCVSAAVLLFLTTPRDRLFKSLRSLGTPRVYVLTLDMCYRYIFLLTDLVRAFYTAKKSRAIRSLPLLEEQKWVGSRIGFTLVRSLDLAEKVHGAMVSRGFRGDVKTLDDFAMRPRDYAALALVAGLFLLVVLYSNNLFGIRGLL